MGSLPSLTFHFPFPTTVMGQLLTKEAIRTAIRRTSPDSFLHDIAHANRLADQCTTEGVGSTSLLFECVGRDFLKEGVLWRSRARVSVRKILRDNGPQPHESRPQELSVRDFYSLFIVLRSLGRGVSPRESSTTTPGGSPSLEDEQREEECPVCMDHAAEVTLPCSHSFCTECARRWHLQSVECPICRQVTLEEQDEFWQLTSRPTQNEVMAHVFSLLDKLARS